MAMPTSFPPVTENWQFSFNGLVMGNPTNYGIVTIDGLDLPPINSGDVSHPFDVGELMGQDFTQGRDITLEVDVYPLETYLPSLNFATVPETVAEEFDIWFYTPVFAPNQLGCTGRIRKKNTTIDLTYANGGMAHVTLAFHCVDPRMYQYPATTNLTWSNAINVNNTGNIEHRPILNLTGPLDNPSVINNTLGGADLHFGSLSSGQVLQVDLLTRLVTLNGVAAPNYVLSTSNWWWIQPGVNNIGFSSLDSSLPAGAGATMTYSPSSWISAT